MNAEWYNASTMLKNDEPVKLSADLHIHSKHSVDGNATIDEMCRAASEKEFNTICFTEHFDMNPEDEGYGYFSFDKYSDDIKRAREKYGAKLTVLKGIEFSEPHLYRKEFETMVGRDFDFVLVSIHYLEDFGAYWVDEKRLQPDYPIEQVYNSYYQAMLKTIKFGGFDAIAHIDFPKRYLPRKYEPKDLLDSIVKELVNRHIALEINSSPIRRGYEEVNPSGTICDLYVEHGGTMITTGSDAHKCEEIGQDFDRVTRIIQHYSFKTVCFVQRKELQL